MRAPNDALKDLLHTSHNRSYFHCEETIQFLHGNLDQSPILTLLLLSLLVGLSELEAQSNQGEQSFQFNAIIVVATGRSAIPSGSKTSAEFKLMGIGSKFS